MISNKQEIPTEHAEQAALIKWADLSPYGTSHIGDFLFSVPNGAQLAKSWQCKKLKAEGLRCGVPDLFLAIPNLGYHGLFIEMKRQKGGVISAEQKAWQERLNRSGYLAVVCRGFDEAKTTIIEYLYPVHG